ncbi:MAG: peptide-binding protein [Deltaproteobacteria bacterium]|nr:peptide-binding protein [Deltaproteobacteria bacterium]
MNKRSTLISAVLVVLLLVIILFQVLSMIQSDRLYERLNQIAGIAPKVESKEKKDNITENTALNNGDWLVSNLTGEPRTLNVISVDSDRSTNAIVMRNIIEPLFYYDLDFDGVKLKPVLAENMQTSADGLEMTIRLKENIWFSDGVPVTSDDIIFTYETIMDPGIDAEDLRGYYANIKDVVKIDSRTVRFIMTEVYWKTIESIGVFEVLPEHIYKYKSPSEFNKRISNPVGSGPYVFEKWDVGQQLVLRKNDNYWGKKPPIDKLVFKFISNSTAAFQAFRSHDLDTFEPSAEQFFEVSDEESFKKEFNILSYWESSGGYSFIGWNQAKDYFKDRRVRIALTMSMDRESVAKHIYKGYTKVVSGPFYIYGKQNDPSIEPWPYDPEKARKLLDESGWVDTNNNGVRDKNGVELKFKLSYGSGNTTAEQILKVFKDNAAKVGVEILPDPVEWSIFIDNLNNKNFEAVMLSWGGTIESDPYQIFHSSQIAGKGNNFIRFSNEEADILIEKARRTLDPNARYELYHSFHKILHEEQPYTFLFARPTFVFLDKRFENVKLHTLGLESFEWYVPKEKQRYK